MTKILTSFIGFFLALVVAIVIFSPERIPNGWGIEPTPVELSVSSDLGSEIFGSLTGKSRINIKLKNQLSKPIYNLEVNLYDIDKKLKHQFIQPQMTAQESLTLGWLQKWNIMETDSVTISAAAYQEVIWSL